MRAQTLLVRPYNFLNVNRHISAGFVFFGHNPGSDKGR
jgi:hypothetical protein